MSNEDPAEMASTFNEFSESLARDDIAKKMLDRIAICIYQGKSFKETQKIIEDATGILISRGLFEDVLTNAAITIKAPDE